MKPFLVLEDINDPSTHIHLFNLMGVEFKGTRWFWLAPLLYFPIAFVVVLLALPDESLGTQIITAVACAFLGYLWGFIHAVGHILSGHYVGAPMDANLFTIMREVNIYHGSQDHFPRRVHVGRSLGGPIANILVGIILLAIWGAVGGFVILFCAILNLFIGILSFFPIPTLDGEVIWRGVIS